MFYFLTRVGFLLGLFFVSTLVIAESTCGFTQTDKSAFDNTIILGQAPPLPGREPSFRFLPASEIASGSIGQILQTTLSIKNSLFLWANRCVVPDPKMNITIPAGANCMSGGNNKPNPWDIHLFATVRSRQTSVQRYWAFFSTYQKANACTRMKMWAFLGEHDIAINIGKNNKFSESQIITSAYHTEYRRKALFFRKNYPKPQYSPPSVRWPEKYQPYFMDTCALPDMTKLQEYFGGALMKNKVHNFLLDYEVQDMRSGESANHFISAINKEISNRYSGKIGIRLFNNTLGFWGAKTSGLRNKSIPKIPNFQNFKGLSIVEYRGTRKRSGRDVVGNLQYQLDIIEKDTELSAKLRKRIFVVYALRNSEIGPDAKEKKLEGAKLTREFIKDKGLGGVMIWFEGSKVKTSHFSPCSSDCHFDWQTLKCLLLNDSYCQVDHPICENKISSVGSNTGTVGTDTAGTKGPDIGTKGSDIGTKGSADTTGTKGSADTTGTKGSADTTGTKGSADTTGTKGSADTTGTKGSADTTGTKGSADTTGTKGSADTTGTKGPADTTGTKGSADTTGTKGSADTTGTKGSADTTGTKGSADTTGTKGSADTTGTKGSADTTGTKGSADTTGTKGSADTTGTVGSYTGTKGSADTTGTKGPADTTGTKGSADTTGTKGSADTTGTKGSADTTGTKGSADTTGTKGPADTTGTKGSADTTGTKGSADTTGTKGPADTTGTKGSADTTGTKGSADTTGTKGSADTTGTKGSADTTGTVGSYTGTKGSADTTGTKGSDTGTRGPADTGETSNEDAGAGADGGSGGSPEDAAIQESSDSESQEGISRLSAVIKWIVRFFRSMASVFQKQADKDQEQAKIYEQGADNYQKLADEARPQSEERAGWLQRVADWFRSKVAWFRGESDNYQKQADSLIKKQADYVEAASKACTVDSDCALVEASCCGCQRGGEYKAAIHKSAKEVHKQLLEERCSASSNSVCSQELQSGCDGFHAQCENSRCVVRNTNKEWQMRNCLQNMQDELTNRQRVELHLQGAPSVGCRYISYKPGSDIWWESYPNTGRCGPIFTASPLSMPPPIPSEEEKDVRLQECKDKLNIILRRGMLDCLLDLEIIANKRYRKVLEANGVASVVCESSVWDNQSSFIWSSQYPKGDCYDADSGPVMSSPRGWSPGEKTSGWSLKNKKAKLEECRQQVLAHLETNGLTGVQVLCGTESSDLVLQTLDDLRTNRQIKGGFVARAKKALEGNPDDPALKEQFAKSQQEFEEVKEQARAAYNSAKETHGEKVISEAEWRDRNYWKSACWKKKRAAFLWPCGTGNSNSVLQTLDDLRTNRQIKGGFVARAKKALEGNPNDPALKEQFAKSQREFEEAKEQARAAYNSAKETHGEKVISEAEWRDRNYWKSACWKKKQAAFLWPCGTGNSNSVLQTLDDLRTNRQIKGGFVARAKKALEGNPNDPALKEQFAKSQREFEEAKEQARAAYNSAKEIYGEKVISEAEWRDKNYWKFACWKKKRAAFLVHRQQPLQVVSPTTEEQSSSLSSGSE